jgi:hypothetical protein
MARKVKTDTEVKTETKDKPAKDRGLTGIFKAGRVTVVPPETDAEQPVVQPAKTKPTTKAKSKSKSGLKPKSKSKSRSRPSDTYVVPLVDADGTVRSCSGGLDEGDDGYEEAYYSAF